jgi:hypothetical protein
MSKAEHIALWVIVGLTTVGLIISTVILAGEIADLRREVAYAVGARPQPDMEETVLPDLPDPPENVGEADVWGSSLNVRALGARSVAHTAVVSLTVRGSGAADPLMDLPVLICNGQQYAVKGDSLEAARQDLLELITQGNATTELQFTGKPDLSGDCTVVINPQQDADSPIAPRIEVPVPQQAPTPIPEPPEAKQEGEVDALLEA